MNRIVKKILCRCFYPFFRVMFRRKNHPEDNILVIKIEHIGDTLVFTPALRALRKARPRARISLCIEKFAIPVFENNPYKDELIIYDKENLKKRPIRFFKFALSLRKRKFSTVISSFNEMSFKYGLLSYLTGAKTTVGYNIENRGLFYTNRLAFHPERHRIQCCLDVVKALHVPDDGLKMDLFIKKETEGKTILFIKEKIKGKFAVIHTESKWQSKEWNDKGWRGVIEKLAELEFTSVLIGVRAEASESLCEGFNALNLTGKTTLEEAAALIKQAAIFIGLDSGPMHIASAFNIPSVILSSAQDISDIWMPLHGRCTVLRKNTECSPCMKACCVRDNLCMELITSEDVFAAAKKILQN